MAPLDGPTIAAGTAHAEVTVEMATPADYVAIAVVDLRRTAARYLATHGLAAPTVPWERIKEAKAAAIGGDGVEV